MGRNKSNNSTPCPNGCGAVFKLGFKNTPKGMVKHLENCGTISALPQELKNVLRIMKNRIGG